MSADLGGTGGIPLKMASSRLAVIDALALTGFSQRLTVARNLWYASSNL